MMPPSERLLRALRVGWLLLALLALVYVLARFQHGSPLQTNVLALVPATEVNPVAEHAVDVLAQAGGERALFLLEQRDPQTATRAAAWFGAQLRGSGAFGPVLAEVPPFDLGNLSAVYLPYRYQLLTPPDRIALAGGGGAEAWQALLAGRLYAPFDSGPLVSLADDPFGWLSHWLAGLPFNALKLEPEGGFLVAHSGQNTAVMVSAALPGSAYDSSTQRAVAAAVAHAEVGLRQYFPGVRLLRTGGVFYAEQARRSAEHDVNLIGTASLLGIIVLMLWVFRSLRLLLLGLLSTAVGIVFALAVTLALFGQLHLLTLVFGASLIGEAVDYSIQYFVLYQSAGSDWQPRAGMRRVRPALTVALATSLVGYAMLGCVPFPALRQIACFAITGIGTAYLTAILVLPACLRRPPASRPRLFDHALRGLHAWHKLLGRREARLALLVLALAAVPGWLRLTSNDDVHLLIHLDPSLTAQEQQIRQAVGLSSSSQFFLVQGRDPEHVLQHEAALSVRLGTLAAAGQLSSWQALSAFVPPAVQQQADHALLARTVFADPAVLSAAFDHAGFRQAVAHTYLNGFAQPLRILTLDTWLASPLAQPFKFLWLGRNPDQAQPETAYASLVVPGDGASLTALQDAARGLDGVTLVDKPGSVSALFGEYRKLNNVWLLGALLMVTLLLLWRYGRRGGLAVMLPLVMAVGATLAILGYLGSALTLFHGLALMLVLGVGVNYSIFLREAYLRGDEDLGAVFTGVLLSAATALLSFGMLGLSSMPALSDFGMTLALGIAIAVALAPLGMPLEETRA
jgi:predicted exporter